MYFKQIFDQAPRQAFMHFGCLKIDVLNKQWKLVKQLDQRLVVVAEHDHITLGRNGHVILGKMGVLEDGTYAINPDCHVEYDVKDSTISIDAICHTSFPGYPGTNKEYCAHTDNQLDELLDVMQEHFPNHRISLESFPYHIHRRGK